MEILYTCFKLLRNNLIAIVVHVLICFICLIPLVSMWVNVSSNVRGYLATGIYTLVVFPLYFFAGRLFLYNTNNILTNTFSVIMLFIIIMLTTFIAYDSIYERVLKAPVYLLGELISQFFHVKQKYVFIGMAILPSLAMWLGMTNKK